LHHLVVTQAEECFRAAPAALSDPHPALYLARGQFFRLRLRPVMDRLLAAYATALGPLQGRVSDAQDPLRMLSQHKEWRRLLEMIDRRPPAESDPEVRGYFGKAADILYPMGGADPAKTASLLRASRIRDAALREGEPAHLFPSVGFDLVPVKHAWKLEWERMRANDAMVALDHAAVLQGFRETTGLVVWEVGGGLGIFACLFKAMFPTTRYIISDVPARLLFSETLIRATYPKACIARREGQPVPEEAHADFVLMPLPETPRAEDGPLELTVGFNGLDDLPCEMVERVIAAAHRAGGRYLHVAELSQASPRRLCDDLLEHLTPFYWPHVIPTASEKVEQAAEGRGVPSLKHTVGWRKLVV